MISPLELQDLKLKTVVLTNNKQTSEERLLICPELVSGWKAKCLQDMSFSAGSAKGRVMCPYGHYLTGGLEFQVAFRCPERVVDGQVCKGRI